MNSVNWTETLSKTAHTCISNFRFFEDKWNPFSLLCAKFGSEIVVREGSFLNYLRILWRDKALMDAVEHTMRSTKSSHKIDVCIFSSWRCMKPSLFLCSISFPSQLKVENITFLDDTNYVPKNYHYENVQYVCSKWIEQAIDTYSISHLIKLFVDT